MIGLSVEDGRFQLICGSPVGQPRYLDDGTVSVLETFARRYGTSLGSAGPAAGLLQLGRDLYRFLDGDMGELTELVERAPRPLRFEVATSKRRPDKAVLTLLRAPWELLADDRGFLAGDSTLRFSPVRRLGRPESPPPLDPYRLGLVFMAASPRGAVELDYEAEETAIMKAVGPTELDLLVEESGNPGELAARLLEVPALQVLHLSCHGHNAWRPVDQPAAEPRPVLMLEGEDGSELPTEAGELIGVLGASRPRFVFLSACLTAAGGGERRSGWPGGKKPGDVPPALVAQSLAEALVDGGIPAVLGWDGSVADQAATAFAATLYDRIAGRTDLADAVADARRDLFTDSSDSDWHLARLWLGPQGGGALVGDRTRRDLMPATHGEKEFLVKEVPVASHEMFVGRRRELQSVLRALRTREHAGVLLHGMGRVGKSSLAFRVANRRRDLRLAVVFEHYGALDILEALHQAVRDDPEARKMAREGMELVRRDPDRFEDALVDLLRLPSLQEGQGKPVLLVIDDLERILEADPNGKGRRVEPDHAPVLRTLINAFDGMIDSRLLLTSRFLFALGGVQDRLYPRPVPPLSAVAQSKLERRQKVAALSGGLSSATLKERIGLLDRVPGVARGNPGLQDLIGLQLVLSQSVTREHAERTLEEMEAWLARGDLPSDAEVREVLESLAVDALIVEAGAAGRDLLRSLTLFELPVPAGVAERLEASVGGSLARLRDLGLADVLEDLVDHRVEALAANALAAGRLKPLQDRERSELARALARPLFEAWGGGEGAGRRPMACDLQLTRLGLVAEEGEVVAACAAGALLALRQGPAREASGLGQAAITLLDRQGRPMPLRLLSETARAAAADGDGATADAVLARGAAELAQQTSAAARDPMAAAFLAYEQAQRLITRGDLDEAERLLRQAAELAAAAGNEISAVVANGRIADILERRGDLDGALRILQEELPVYERLGDVRSRAVTMGKIADILESRGDLDGALRIRQEEQLPVFERLGDVHSRAVTMGKIADILESRGDLDGALRIRQEEQLPVFERLGDVHSRAVTMGKIADILESRGDLDGALRIRQEEQLPVFERLGDVHSRAVTMGKIADILESRGDLDGALRIRQEEQLPVYERLGDVRERAVTMGKIADILESRGDLDGARARHEESLAEFRRLKDPDGTASALWGLAQIDLAQKQMVAAAPRISEAHALLTRLERADGIAVVGLIYGQLLAAAGEPALAREVLGRSAEMFRTLGQEYSARQAEELASSLPLSPKEGRQ